MTFAAIIASARRATWGWPYRVWPEDARQEIALLLLELGEGNVRLRHVASCLERLARNYGWTRPRRDGRRVWMRGAEVLAAPVVGYLFSPERKRLARAKVTSARRHEIAAKGGHARWSQEKMRCIN